MAKSDKPDWHDNDEEILAFQEEYPDVYDFVLKVLDGNCDDAALQAFANEYGEAYLEDFLEIKLQKKTFRSSGKNLEITSAMPL